MHYHDKNRFFFSTHVVILFTRRTFNALTCYIISTWDHVLKVYTIIPLTYIRASQFKFRYNLALFCLCFRQDPNTASVCYIWRSQLTTQMLNCFRAVSRQTFPWAKFDPHNGAPQRADGGECIFFCSQWQQVFVFFFWLKFTEYRMAGGLIGSNAWPRNENWCSDHDATVRLDKSSPTYSTAFAAAKKNELQFQSITFTYRCDFYLTLNNMCFGNFVTERKVPSSIYLLRLKSFRVVLFSTSYSDRQN